MKRKKQMLTNRMKRKKRILISRVKIGIVAVMSTCIFAACGATKQQVVTITNPSYEKLNFQTAEVKRGDLSTSVELELAAEGYEEVSYRVFKDGLEVDKVYVSVGDRVKKGEVLVSFKSEAIYQKIADFEDDKSQKELLLQHYENLMQIDEEMEYESDINMLREDIQVAQLYIEEAKNLLADYRIVAEGDGIITDISDYLQNGVVEPDVQLMEQATGTGRYLAEVADTSLYAVGEVYTVSIDEMECELQLAAIEGQTLVFEPVSGAALVSVDDELTLIREMPEQKDVVYVNRHAVCTINGNGKEEDTYCVYVMQENGFQRAVFVTPGERIGNDIIIKEGLNGGEKVVIR